MRYHAQEHTGFSAVKGVRAILIAGALVGITSVASAAPITFTTCDPAAGASNNADTLFPGAANFCESQHFLYTPVLTTHEFAFNPEDSLGPNILDDLSFQAVLRAFDLYLTAFFVTVGNPAFLSRIPAGFIPEPMVTSFGPRWMYFRVENLPGTDHPPQSGLDYGHPNASLPAWEQIITYFGNPNVNNPQMLHDPRPLNVFANIITNFFDPFCSPAFCGGEFGFTDPAIGGGADDFSDVTIVATQAVPEPMSLLLLGSGLGGLLYRRRRVTTETQN